MQPPFVFRSLIFFSRLSLFSGRRAQWCVYVCMRAHTCMELIKDVCHVEGKKYGLRTIFLCSVQHFTWHLVSSLALTKLFPPLSEFLPHTSVRNVKEETGFLIFFSCICLLQNLPSLHQYMPCDRPHPEVFGCCRSECMTQIQAIHLQSEWKILVFKIPSEKPRNHSQSWLGTWEDAKI